MRFVSDQCCALFATPIRLASIVCVCVCVCGPHRLCLRSLPCGCALQKGASPHDTVLHDIVSGLTRSHHVHALCLVVPSAGRLSGVGVPASCVCVCVCARAHACVSAHNMLACTQSNEHGCPHTDECGCPGRLCLRSHASENPSKGLMGGEGEGGGEGGGSSGGRSSRRRGKPNDPCPSRVCPWAFRTNCHDTRQGNWVGMPHAGNPIP
mmetsp:Transcript_22590/g.38625  ORF Transcript_22590/g.38625 Transcript_22590/m.38625 type:complete len:209 (-) Transcript_22590:1663-2289(-)